MRRHHIECLCTTIFYVGIRSWNLHKLFFRVVGAEFILWVIMYKDHHANYFLDEISICQIEQPMKTDLYPIEPI